MRSYIDPALLRPCPASVIQRLTWRQRRRLVVFKWMLKHLGLGLLCSFVMLAPALVVGLGWVQG